jgi:hypothetical protein
VAGEVKGGLGIVADVAILRLGRKTDARMRFGTIPMSLFEPAKLSPKRIERRRKIWMKGRKRFILLRGILGWGVSTFVVITLSNWYGKYGWHAPPAPELYYDIAVELAIWLAAGYFWAASVWETAIEATVLDHGIASDETEKI